MQEAQVLSLGLEDPLEEGTATHSSILAWKLIPWTEEPGGLQSMRSQKSPIRPSTHSSAMYHKPCQAPPGHKEEEDSILVSKGFLV